MEFGIVTTVRPLSGAFVGITTLNTTTAWDVAVTLLAAHIALGACLAILGHGSMDLVNVSSYHNFMLVLIVRSPGQDVERFVEVRSGGKIEQNFEIRARKWAEPRPGPAGLAVHHMMLDHV